LLNLSDQIQGRTICALGDAAAMPVRAFVKNYREEFEYHIDHQRCMVPAGGYSSAVASTDALKMAAD
jgi:NADH-quinone oxidoreductase subunit F